MANIIGVRRLPPGAAVRRQLGVDQRHSKVGESRLYANQHPSIGPIRPVSIMICHCWGLEKLLSTPGSCLWSHVSSVVDLSIGVGLERELVSSAQWIRCLDA